jgi:hypothetical protein
VTDGAGRFVMPATQRTERVIWLVPVEPAPRPAFTLCAVGGTSADDGAATAAVGTVAFDEVSVVHPSPAGNARAEGVACLAARSRDGRRVECP